MSFRSFTILIVLLFIAGIAACGPGSGSNGKTVITVAHWGEPVEERILRETLRVFEKEHPGLSVRMVKFPYDNYQSSLITRMSGKGSIDVLLMSSNFYPAFIEKKLLKNLTSLVNNDSEFDRNSYFPEIINEFTVNGSVYVVPRDISPIACVFYNKKHFSERGIPAPSEDWTWDDMKETAQKLTVTGDQGIERYGFYSGVWYNFVYGAGGEIVDTLINPHRCMLNSPNAQAGMQYFVDLVQKDHVSPDVSYVASYESGEEGMFIDGKVSMLHSGIWLAPVFAEQITDFEWDVVMFPKHPKTGRRSFDDGGSGYAIYAGTAHPEESWMVVKALAGDAAQTMLAQTGLVQPAKQTIAAGKSFLNPSVPPAGKDMLNRAVAYVHARPFTSKWADMEDCINQGIEEMLNGTRTVEDGMERMTQDINAALMQ